MDSDNALLWVEGLRAAYGKVEALKGVHVRVTRGEIVCILGANGAGKTTFLHTVCGLRSAKAGKILLEGEDISGYRAHRIVEKGLTMVPEGRQIFGPFTVYENLELGALTRLRGGKRKEVEETLASVYDLFPRLYDRRRQVAATLSGGEQQMLAMGRALMAHPRLLLLDEPSLGLAPIIIDAIFEALVNLNGEGLTIVLVEQNAEAALSIARHGYVMTVGKIAIEGPANTLSGDKLNHIYLGGVKPKNNIARREKSDGTSKDMLAQYLAKT
jgi:branched-chain amino acid transport system ATP-binding protein